MKMVTQSLITRRLDYGNTLYIGISAWIIKRLQVVYNEASRLVLNLPPGTIVTAHLCNLHWLPFHKWSLYKLFTNTYKAPHNFGPSYLSSRIHFMSYQDNFALHFTCSLVSLASNILMC